MTVVDLTLRIPLREGGKPTSVERDVLIASAGATYTGVVYDFSFSSMAGTYIDFPGHIRETDDGLDAASYPVDKLLRVDSAVIHLDRASGSGAVSAEELDAACPPCDGVGAIVLNALGARRFDEIEERSVFLGSDAVSWLIDRGIHLFVSDIYESTAIHGVFNDLFGAGISTVCSPVNLQALTDPRAKLSVFCPAFPGVTQIPCRLIAELED